MSKPINESSSKSTASLAFILLPIVLVSGVGMLYNNLSNSGLTVSNTLTCLNVYPFTCQNSNAVGCQSVPSQCGLSGNSFSVLNKDSPFTFLFTGNIAGFFTALSSNSNVNRGAFDPNGGGTFYTADCSMSGVPASTNLTTNVFPAHINACTETNPDGSNMTKYAAPSTTLFQTFTWSNWNGNLLNSAPVAIPFFHIWNNASYALTCLNQGWWEVTSQPQVGYAIEGCDYYVAAGYSPPANPNVNPVYSFLVAVPCNLGGTSGCGGFVTTGNYHVKIFVQPQSWDTQFCTNAFLKTTQDEANWYGSQNCVNLETWFTTPHSGGLQAGFFTPFLTLLLGIVLFLIGMGINLQAGGSIFGSGTQFGVGTNPQGSKMAQIVGLGLIVWSPLFSEFGGWLAFLGLGIGTFLTLLVTGLFFFGLYERI